MPAGGLKPTFLFTLDAELVWGSFDQLSVRDWDAAYPRVRDAIRGILTILERYEIAATWAVVGHLFLGSCQRAADGRAHPEIVRPLHAWHPRDWLADDPCSDRTSAPLWYGDDIIELLLRARVAQEIGSHSFSHMIYGDPGCSAAAVRSDLKACVEAARRWGISLQSFVFPRNVEGHHHLLQEFGFRSFRGTDPTWFRGLGRRSRRAAGFFDQAAALPPPVVTPSEQLPGLWNIPGSMHLMHHGGVRRLVPFAAQVAKGKAGLRRAAERGGVFHLWSHPFNFAVERTSMLRVIEEILAEAARLRKAGTLEIRTMGSLVGELASGSEKNARRVSSPAGEVLRPTLES